MDQLPQDEKKAEAHGVHCEVILPYLGEVS